MSKVASYLPCSLYYTDMTKLPSDLFLDTWIIYCPSIEDVDKQQIIINQSIWFINIKYWSIDDLASWRSIDFSHFTLITAWHCVTVPANSAIYRFKLTAVIRMSHAKVEPYPIQVIHTHVFRKHVLGKNFYSFNTCTMHARTLWISFPLMTSGFPYRQYTIG